MQDDWKSSSSVLWNVNAWNKKNCLINADDRFLTIVYKQCVFLSLPLLKRFHLKFFIYLTKCPSNGVFYTLHWVIWHYSKSLMKGNTKSFDHISHTLSQDETAYIIYKQLAFRYNIQKQPPTGVLRKRCSEKMQQIYRRTPMPKCNFNKVAKQLYWNLTLAWVFSCKFAAYFQNNFSEQPLDGCFWIFIANVQNIYSLLIHHLF